MTEIMAFDPKRVNNAQAIRDAHLLGYLTVDDFIFDATYGLGRFWTLWKPGDSLQVVKNDIDPTKGNCHFDYRDLPYSGGYFDAVVFDPPYKLNGTGGSHPSDEGYGVATPYQRTSDFIADMWIGLAECLRVTKPGGYLLFKTQDQVVSGQKRWLSIEAPQLIDARLVDELYVCGYRQQPTDRKCPDCDGRGKVNNPYGPGMHVNTASVNCRRCDGSGRVPIPQKHARSNVSVLQIYVKEK